jgi:hypothetical protein
MEKSWQQINREVDSKLDHEAFSEKLIFLLVGASAIAALAGAPKVWTMLWVLPTFGYLLGRHVTENLRYQQSDYWLLSFGSQVLLAVIVGVLLLVRSA